MSGCPPAEKLEAFSRGLLPAAERDLVATHVATCSSCGSKLGTALFDSPLPSHRRISNDLLASVDIKEHTRDLGVADTEITSGERRDPTPGAAPTYARGSTLARYVILEQLAKGGMGEVYAAYDPDLDRKVAIKLLRSDFRGSSNANEMRLRLLREAQAMARLSHPNVVTVHDVGLVGDQVFVAMEFIEGQTLTQWLKSQPRSWAQILDIYLYAGRGLAAAHAVGLTHRDFKPDNVVVGKDMRVRVMDFGLAHAQAASAIPTPAPDPLTESGGGMKRRITPPGAIMGTPAYMSPEQLDARPTDPRSDQFSFCVALYEGLYGERPFAGESPAAIAVEIAQDRVRAAPPHSKVPVRIRKLLLRGLRADPGQRYRQIDALLINLSRRKSAVRRQWTAIGAASVVVITMVAAIQATRSASARCAAVSERLAGVWDTTVRDQARTAFLSTHKPWAEHAWDDASKAIDTYTARWVVLRREACEARADAPDEALGARIVCLGRRLNDVQAVTALFSRADAEIVERAVASSLALPPLEACVADRTAPRNVDTHESEAVRVQLAQAKAHLDTGKYAEGLKLAEDALAKAGASTDRGARADAQLLTGILTGRLGGRGADALLESAAIDAEGAREDETAARAWIERVGLGAIAGRYDDAETWGRLARAAVDRIGRADELEAALANSLGVLAWSRGRYDDAVANYMRAISFRQQAFGPKHPLVARSWTNVGTALKAAGKYDEAIAAYRKAQEIEEATLDPSHPAVAETLNNLGNALNEKGDHAAAVAAFKKSLEIKEQAFGADALTIGVTLTNLGAVLLQTQQLDDARAMLERALAIKEKASGSQSVTVAVTLTNLAAVERAANKPSRAMELDHRALLIRERTLGPAHRDLAFNLTGEGDALLALQRPAEAVAPLERAMALREGSAGEPTLLASTRLSLAQALAQSKKPADRQQALQLARLALPAWPEGNPEHAKAAALEAKLQTKRK